MALVKPFAALRPVPELAGRICELPYDVLSTEEARALAEGNPLSFLRVSKAEIEFPPGSDAYAPAIYGKAAENFKKLIEQKALLQDPGSCFYLYRQVFDSHTQVGLAAVARCSAYLSGRIKKHELTRPEKEDDRLRHIKALNAQTGPAFLVYRAIAGVDEFVRRKILLPPDIDFSAPDGVRHSCWVVSNPHEVRLIEEEFTGAPCLYIADGHHRTAAAARLSLESQGSASRGWFLGVIFPHDQVRILPYNRLLKDLNNNSPADLRGKLEKVFHVKSQGCAQPLRVHQVSFYMDSAWQTLEFRPELSETQDAAEGLDVSLLQKHVLGPIFGIDNPRTSDRIHFVGGIRGTVELEKGVDSGEYACAFSMFPTRIEDLMAVADAGGIMPPKSTWFEPKLRDGMFSHLLQ